MLNIESLQSAQHFIEQGQSVAKQIHQRVVVEKTTAGVYLLELFAEADARAEAAFIVLDALNGVGAGKDVTEIDVEAAERVFEKLINSLQEHIHIKSPSQTVWMLNHYVRWLGGAIAEMR